MGGWKLLHVSIAIKLIVYLLAHRRSLNEDFEHNVTAVTTFLVYKFI